MICGCRKNFIFVLLVSSLSVSLAWAQPKTNKSESVSALKASEPIHFLLAYGSELRSEKDVNDDWNSHYLTHYSLGVGWQRWLFMVESARFTEASGNNTLNVERLLEDNMLWAQWRPIQWHQLTPYVGGGAGAYRETITTHLSGISSVDDSPWRPLTGVNFGLAFEPKILWLAMEARLLFGDQLDQQPTLGAVFRAGIWF